MKNYYIIWSEKESAPRQRAGITQECYIEYSKEYQEWKRITFKDAESIRDNLLREYYDIIYNHIITYRRAQILTQLNDLYVAFPHFDKEARALTSLVKCDVMSARFLIEEVERRIRWIHGREDLTYEFTCKECGKKTSGATHVGFVTAWEQMRVDAESNPFYDEED